VQDQYKKQTTPIELKLTNDGYVAPSVLNQIYDLLQSQTSRSSASGIYSSIQNVLSGAQDPYTVFFPPTNAKQFNEELQGEFEGI